MNASNTYMASNLQKENIRTSIPMSVHQSQLTFRSFIHDNLFRTCQVRMKTVNLVSFIQRHEEIRSL